MFDPVSIGLQVGGSLAQFMAADEADAARSEALQRERTKRMALMRNNEKALKFSLAGVDPRVLAAARGVRSDALKSTFVPMDSIGPAAGSGAGPAGVAARQASTAVANDAARDASATANLDAFKDFSSELSDRHQKVGETIGTNADFMRGNQRILELALKAAEAKRKSAIGDLLLMGGQVVGQAGGLKGLFGGKPTNIVPSALGAPQTIPLNTPFQPAYFAPTPQIFRGIY